MQRVFEIAYHKCEYVGDAVGVRERHIASQKECLKTIEAGLPRLRAARPAAQERESARGRDRRACRSSPGLIANWVLDPKSFPLERHAESLVDIYFRGLVSAPEGKIRKNR